MYVVRRPFKNFGKTLVAGDIIDDPATIKRFKNKLAEGKILEVTDGNRDRYAEYFQLKFGVDILRQENATEKPAQAKPKQAKSKQVVVTAKAVQ